VLTSLLAATLLALLDPAASDSVVSLRPSRYELDIKVDIDSQQLTGHSRIVLLNATNSPVTTASLLLYRLMRASSVRDANGSPLTFTQPVVEFDDHPTLQVRQIIVTLPKPLGAGDSTQIAIDYRGELLGYSETGMLYVRDHIDSAYTLIRDDAFAFPYVGLPSHRANRSAGLASYSYRARITVPAGFTVANGGRLVSKSSAAGWTTFEYTNIKPAWRMDFAVARFTVLEGGAVRIFHLPEDSSGGKRILGAMNRTLATYSRWFGPMSSASQFTLIEIPTGWGSQADVTSILQTAAAFRNPQRQLELYHELSHLWNVNATDRPAPRWEEGLATFMEDVTTDSIEHRMTTDSSADRIAERLASRTKDNAQLTQVPMVSYGCEEMTGNSYSVGALMFYTMYRLMGHQQFVRLVGEYYRRYGATGGSTDDFARLAKELSPVPLDKVFDDWMYSPHWTQLVSAMPGHSIPSRYRR
jgi:aminopeptidase N